MMGTIMNVMIVNAQLAWFPTLFVRVHEWEPQRIALALAVVGVPFGIISAITAGYALTWLATLYPARRAAATPPAVALRYE